MELRSAQSMRSERVVTGYRYPCNNCGCKEFDFLRQSQDPLLAKYFGADPAAGPDQTVVWSNKPGVADTFKLADLKKAFATLGLDPDKAASTQSYSAIGLDRSAVVQQWQETSYSYDGETWVSADAARSDLDFKYMRFVRTTQEATARVLDVVAEIYENQGGRWALVDRSQQMVAEGDLLPTRSRLSDWRMISGTAAKPKPTFVEPPKGRRFGDEND